MIGNRAVTSALIAAFAVVGLGPGGPRPELAIGADRLVAARAEAADAAVAALQAELGTILDVAREGAAAILAGERSPGALLTEAGDLLLATRAAAGAANDAVAALESALDARDPSAEAIPAATDGAELGSIGAQLAATAEAADRFAAMRQRAANVPVALNAALSALTERDLDAAEEHLAMAAGDQAAVAGWEGGGAALPVWEEATHATIEALQRLLAAIRAGDQAAAREAADEFAALSDEATRADRALQITISEGAAGVAAAPLARLAEAKRLTDAQRAEVGRVVADSRR